MSSEQSVVDLNDISSFVVTETAVNDEEAVDVLGNEQIFFKILHSSKPSIEDTVGVGDLVTIDMVGELNDGHIVEIAKDKRIHIGDFEIIHGLDLAMPMLSVGDIAEISVQSHFAYKNMGLKQRTKLKKIGRQVIPPDEAIKYMVYLKDIQKQHPDQMNYVDNCVRCQYATDKRERANFWYKRQEYHLAIHLYQRALQYLHELNNDAIGLSDVAKAMQHERLLVYNNLAMAQLQLCDYDAALLSVNSVLSCQPNNSKALWRKGTIMLAKAHPKIALTLMQKALVHDSRNKYLQQDIAGLQTKLRIDNCNDFEFLQSLKVQFKELEEASHRKVSTIGLVCALFHMIAVAIPNEALRMALHCYKI